MDEEEVYNLGELLDQVKQAIAKACNHTTTDHEEEDDENDNNEFCAITPIIAASDLDDTYEISICPETGRETMEYLDLSEFAIRFVPEEVFRLFMLQSLHFSKCYALSRISPSIQKLKGLVELDLSRCTALTQLPEEIFASLPKLNRLTLAYCANLEELPEDWSGMRNLTSLYLEGCTSLKKVPNGLWEECHKLVYLGMVCLACIDPCLPLCK